VSRAKSVEGVRDKDADAKNNKKCSNSFKHGCFQAIARVRSGLVAQSKRFDARPEFLLLFCHLGILGNGSTHRRNPSQ
jgi:hypothetical protein